MLCIFRLKCMDTRYAFENLNKMVQQKTETVNHIYLRNRFPMAQFICLRNHSYKSCLPIYANDCIVPSYRIQFHAMQQFLISLTP